MTIYREKVLTVNDLFRVISLPDGTLTNVNTITYKIDRVSGETLIPVVTATNATNSATGIYFAGWTVPANATLGNYRITWTWKLNSGSTEQTATQDFEIIAATTSANEIPVTDEYNYCITADEIYAEGVSSETYSESIVKASIRYNQEYIEKLTGYYFYQKETNYTIDGHGGIIEKLPHPAISVSQVAYKENGVFVTQTLANFIIYNEYPKDRKYPKIAIDYAKAGVFPEGIKNIKITGVFGYVNEELETPEPIKRVLKMLVIANLTPIASEKNSQKKLNELRREKVGDVEREFHENVSKGFLTGNAKVDNILAEYVKSGSVYMI